MITGIEILPYPEQRRCFNLMHKASQRVQLGPHNMFAYCQMYGADKTYAAARGILSDKKMDDEFWKRLYNGLLYYESTFKQN